MLYIFEIYKHTAIEVTKQYISKSIEQCAFLNYSTFKNEIINQLSASLKQRKRDLVRTKLIP